MVNSSLNIQRIFEQVIDFVDAFIFFRYSRRCVSTHWINIILIQRDIFLNLWCLRRHAGNFPRFFREMISKAGNSN